jgi:hypothetical protein
MKISSINNRLLIMHVTFSCSSLLSSVTAHSVVRSPYLFCLLTVGVEALYFSLAHTQTHTTFSKAPLDEGSARRRDHIHLLLYIFSLAV